MSEHTATQRNTPDNGEIDLRQLFAAIGRFFNRIGRAFIMAIIWFRRASRKYILLIAAGLLIGAGMGYLSFNAFKPYYSSQMVVSSRYYSAEMMENAIQELNQLAGEGNDAILARKLGLSPEQAAQIRSFETAPITTTEDMVTIENILQQVKDSKELDPAMQEALRERLTNTFYNFEVVVTVYDITILDTLEKGLNQYLYDNDYVKRRVSVENENLRLLRDKLRQDQKQLNQLKTLQAEAYKRIAETGQTGSNNVIFGTPETVNAPLNVYLQDLDFSRELLETNKKLELNRALEVVSGFTPYGRPASLSFKGQLITGALIGLGMAYLIIMLLSMNQALNRYETNYLSRKTA
ncbi:MAG: hypothetical protein KY428_02770 [Bacteroidetes bacterium]|nr:hypothetical protein [Bacteroidota bacterium]